MACYFRPANWRRRLPATWSCDGDEATAVMDGEAELISAFRFPARVAEPMKSEPGPPMTLGAAAAAVCGSLYGARCASIRSNLARVRVTDTELTAR